MQQDLPEVIQRLCVTAGTIMEDASLDAVSIVSRDPGERHRQLLTLTQAGIDIAVLLAAAAVLDRRCASDRPPSGEQ